MKFNNPYWSNKTKIELLQRWILTHSFLYYELNYTIVSDERFDQNSQQLARAKEKFPKSWKESKYSYAMQDFDGSTGFGYVQQLDPEHRGAIERDAWYLRRKY
jgi:NAD-dependent DNA ligase